MNNQPENQENPDYVTQLLRVVNRRKITIAAVFLLSLIAGIALSNKLPRVYETQAIIRIGTIKGPLMTKSDCFFLIKGGKVLTKTLQNINIPLGITELKKVIRVEDIAETPNFFKIKVRRADPESALKICKATAESFVLVGQQDFFDKNIKLLNDQIASLHTRIGDFKQNAEDLRKQLNDQGAAFRDILLINNSLSRYSDNLLTLIQEEFLLRSLVVNANNFEVYEAPVLPDAPVMPNRGVIISIALNIGLILAVGAGFMREYLAGRKKAGT